jgi:hypothetical protein
MTHTYSLKERETLATLYIDDLKWVKAALLEAREIECISLDRVEWPI